MKILITHINPHLDDIAAIWLYEKFHPEFARAKLKFISAEEGNQGLKEAKDKIYFGVGRGRFDEHKGDTKECATSLVWQEVKGNRQETALDQLVEWVKKVDLGLTGDEFDAFSLPAFIRPRGNSQQGSKKAVELGGQILDRILDVLKRNSRAAIDWQEAISFHSKFGRSYAISSHEVTRAFCQSKRGDLFLMYDPKYRSVQFYSASNDLESIYKKVKELDPQASWYLHQSHHMVLCGSSSAPNAKPTKLSFEQLIEAAKV